MSISTVLRLADRLPSFTFPCLGANAMTKKTFADAYEKTKAAAAARSRAAGGQGRDIGPIRKPANPRGDRK